jgi:hypothetical protein
MGPSGLATGANSFEGRGPQAFLPYAVEHYLRPSIISSCASSERQPVSLSKLAGSSASLREEKEALGPSLGPEIL